VKTNGARYSPAFKFQVVLEALKGKGTEAQVARAYGVHPVTLANWKRHFLEHGAEVFGGKRRRRPTRKRWRNWNGYWDGRKSRLRIFAKELTLEKKLELVRKHRGKYGPNLRLRALEVPESSWRRSQGRSKVSQEDEELKAKVLQVVGEYPACGYRRVKVELAARYGTVVNHKRLRRCLREWDLVLKREVLRPRPSGVRKILKEAKGKLNLIRGWGPDPFQVLCTDFTEIKYAGGTRKAYLWR